MKKTLFTLLLGLMAFTAQAQVYVGGSMGFWRNYDDNHTTLTIAPEVGYKLSDKWDLGTSVGFTHLCNKGVKVNGIAIDPYARWSYVKFGPVSLHLDMGFGLNTYKVKDADDSQVGWRIGVAPGVRISMAKHIDFVASVGFLGFRDADDDYCSYGEDGFGFHVSGNDLRFGINYRF